MSKQSDTTDLLSESCGHDCKALPTYYDRSVMVMEGEVCTVVIALQERRAYYPPLCAGSNGEGEAILSFTVMMHFKWDMPIIYHWKVIAGERTPGALLLMLGDCLEKAGVQRNPACFYADGWNERGAALQKASAPREGAAGLHGQHEPGRTKASTQPLPRSHAPSRSIISSQLAGSGGGDGAATASALGRPWKKNVFLSGAADGWG